MFEREVLRTGKNTDVLDKSTDKIWRKILTFSLAVLMLPIGGSFS